MPLIYITGPAGSGKSTIGEELRNRGYVVYDTDKDGIRHWINQQTGEPIRSFQKGETHTKEWLNDHKLGLSKSWLIDLKTKNPDRPVFICGTSPIDYVNADIYDKVIALVINEQTLVNRVKTRTNNQYGKDPNQLKKAIKWRQATINRYKNTGAFEIDASLPLREVIEKLIKEVP